MNIYHDLEKIKLVALHYAKEHHCNYNIIILNPNEHGEFDFMVGSTYEYVTDSYFQKDRPNAKIIFKTDDLLENEAIEPFHIDENGREYYPSFFASNNEYGLMASGLSNFGLIDKRPPQYIREKPKIGRNSPCFCSSGKKYKNCCLV